MSITLTSDPIMDPADAQAFLDTQNETRLIQVINSLSEKFKKFTQRVQINEDQSTDITEWLRGSGGRILYLHCSPIYTASGVTATIYDDGSTDSEFTLADSDFRVQSENEHAFLQLYSNEWPEPNRPQQVVKVVYRGGFPTVPGDIIEGAILQARVDLKRMEGEIGYTTHGRRGESVSVDTQGLIEQVRDLWGPYRIMA